MATGQGRQRPVKKLRDDGPPPDEEEQAAPPDEKAGESESPSAPDETNEAEDASAPVKALYEFDGTEIGTPLTQEDLALLHRLGEHFNAEVLVLSHGHGGAPDELESLGERVYQLIARFAKRVKGKNVVLVLDSPGGQANAAYKIARMLQRTCAAFIVAVPRYAKSAATLLSLGATTIAMGSLAELGPLDVQLFTREREEWGSALDEVQALDRITAAAITQADQAMLFLMTRTGKKIETLLPHALDFAAKLQAPLVKKIDAVHYSQQSRMLKVAEDYAVRLLGRLPEELAQRIASQFVNAYPEHGFVIDKQEAVTLLPIDPSAAVEELLDEISVFINPEGSTFIGMVGETSEGDADAEN